MHPPKMPSDRPVYYFIDAEVIDPKFLDMMMKEVEEAIECPILQARLVNPVVLIACGHEFSKEAIDQWYMNKPSRLKKCVVCNEIAPKLFSDRVIQELANKVLTTLNAIKANLDNAKKEKNSFDVSELIDLSTTNQDAFLLASCGHTIGLEALKDMVGPIEKPNGTVLFDKKDVRCPDPRCKIIAQSALPHRALRAISTVVSKFKSLAKDQANPSSKPLKIQATVIPPASNKSPFQTFQDLIKNGTIEELEASFTKNPEVLKFYRNKIAEECLQKVKQSKDPAISASYLILILRHWPNLSYPEETISIFKDKLPVMTDYLFLGTDRDAVTILLFLSNVKDQKLLEWSINNITEYLDANYENVKLEHWDRLQKILKFLLQNISKLNEKQILTTLKLDSEIYSDLKLIIKSYFPIASACFPLFKKMKPHQLGYFEIVFRRYLFSLVTQFAIESSQNSTPLEVFEYIKKYLGGVQDLMKDDVNFIFNLGLEAFLRLPETFSEMETYYFREGMLHARQLKDIASNFSFELGGCVGCCFEMISMRNLKINPYDALRLLRLLQVYLPQSRTDAFRYLRTVIISFNCVDRYDSKAKYALLGDISRTPSDTIKAFYQGFYIELHRLTNTLLESMKEENEEEVVQTFLLLLKTAYREDIPNNSKCAEFVKNVFNALLSSPLPHFKGAARILLGDYWIDCPAIAEYKANADPALAQQIHELINPPSLTKWGSSNKSGVTVLLGASIDVERLLKKFFEVLESGDVDATDTFLNEHQAFAQTYKTKLYLQIADKILAKVRSSEALRLLAILIRHKLATVREINTQFINVRISPEHIFSVPFCDGLVVINHIESSNNRNINALTRGQLTGFLNSGAGHAVFTENELMTAVYSFYLKNLEQLNANDYGVLLRLAYTVLPRTTDALLDGCPKILAKCAPHLETIYTSRAFCESHLSMYRFYLDALKTRICEAHIQEKALPFQEYFNTVVALLLHQKREYVELGHSQFVNMSELIQTNVNAVKLMPTRIQFINFFQKCLIGLNNNKLLLNTANMNFYLELMHEFMSADSYSVYIKDVIYSFGCVEHYNFRTASTHLETIKAAVKVTFRNDFIVGESSELYTCLQILSRSLLRMMEKMEPVEVTFLSALLCEIVITSGVTKDSPEMLALKAKFVKGFIDSLLRSDHEHYKKAATELLNVGAIRKCIKFARA